MKKIFYIKAGKIAKIGLQMKTNYFLTNYNGIVIATILLAVFMSCITSPKD